MESWQTKSDCVGGIIFSITDMSLYIVDNADEAAINLQITKKSM